MNTLHTVQSRGTKGMIMMDRQAELASAFKLLTWLQWHGRALLYILMCELMLVRWLLVGYNITRLDKVIVHTYRAFT